VRIQADPAGHLSWLLELPEGGDVGDMEPAAVIDPDEPPAHHRSRVGEVKPQAHGLELGLRGPLHGVHGRDDCDRADGGDHDRGGDAPHPAESKACAGLGLAGGGRIRLDMLPVVQGVRRALLPAVLLSFAFGAAACGSGGDEGRGTGDGGGQRIEIAGTEFALDPSQVQVDQPGTYTFAFRNEGGTVHALEVEGRGVEEKTEEIDAGQTAELTVDLSEVGEYEIYCPVGNHKEQGMEGTLVVGGAAGGSGTTTEGDTTTGEDETTTGGGSGGGY
jgi:plastocyanin